MQLNMNFRLFLYSFLILISFSNICFIRVNKLTSNNAVVVDSIDFFAKVDTIVKKAYSVMGTPYKWAGASPSTGFDCSGFVYWCFKHVGITIPRSSQGLYAMGEKIEMRDAQAGDVILFKGTNANTKGVGHVGIVTSLPGNELKFVHSSSSKQHWGVIETIYGQSYYTKRFIGVRRLIKIKNN